MEERWTELYLVEQALHASQTLSVQLNLWIWNLGHRIKQIQGHILSMNMSKVLLENMK